MPSWGNLSGVEVINHLDETVSAIKIISMALLSFTNDIFNIAPPRYCPRTGLMRRSRDSRHAPYGTSRTTDSSRQPDAFFLKEEEINDFGNNVFFLK